MLEIVFLVIAIITISLLYKENIQLKTKNKTLQEHYEKLDKKHTMIENTQHNLIQVNAKLHEDLKKTEQLEHENDKLKFILKQNDIQY